MPGRRKKRFRCSLYFEIGIHFRSDSLFTFSRNMHVRLRKEMSRGINKIG